MPSSKPRIGVIGAGRLGTAVARLSLRAGYDVMIANSKAPESLKLIVNVLMPEARAARIEEVIRGSDIVVLAIPLHQYRSLDPDWFDGKTVIDAMNYWSPTEGHIDEFADETSSSSEYIQRYLAGAKVVKTLNHVAYNELEEHSLPHGSAHRRAVLMAGDDAVSKTLVATYVDQLGFDVVDLGSLKMGKRYQPDTKLFNARFTAPEVAQLLQ